MDSRSNNTTDKEDQANYLNIKMNHVYENLSKRFVQSYSKFQYSYEFTFFKECEKTVLVCMDVILYLHVCLLSVQLPCQNCSSDTKECDLAVILNSLHIINVGSFAKEPAEAQNLIVLAINLWILEKWREEVSVRVKILWDDQVYEESHEIRCLLNNCTSPKHLFSARSCMKKKHWTFSKVAYPLENIPTNAISDFFSFSFNIPMA